MITLPGIPDGFVLAFAFVFGALVGSFLNVVIARVPHGKSVVWPPSHCGSCKKPIKPYHNIPILSWLLLRGRCANCKAPFSVRYALVELAFGLVCAFAVYQHGLSLVALHKIVMMGFLLPLALIDLDTWLLPHVLTWSGTVVGLLLALANGFDVFMHHLFAAALGITALIIVGFVAERIFKKEAMGGGDPWLLGLIGAFLGVRALLPVILLSSLQGALIGGAMLVARRRREATAPPPEPKAPAREKTSGKAEDADDEEEWRPDATAIPYGPFLALAAAEILYFTRIPELLFPYL